MEIPEWICPYCGFRENILRNYYWRCPRCGKPLKIKYRSHYELLKGVRGIKRYSKLLPLTPEKSMGEAETPLVVEKENNNTLLFKLEYLNPSGSFKDRGTSLAIYYGYRMRYKRVVEDSSGNTGISVALYSRLYGLKTKIYMPSYAPWGKKILVRALGGEVVETRDRAEASNEVLKQVKDSYYVAHTWNYFYVIGASTIAYEVYEEYGAPDYVISPIGSGGLFLGLVKGFKDLYRWGLIKSLPRFIGVQGYSVHPVYERITGKRVEGESRLADGIMVPNPPRLGEIVSELRSVKGDVVLVGDRDIVEALRELYRKGYIVEPTSASAWAAYARIKERINNSTILIPLTGSGLKTLDIVEDTMKAHGP